MGTRSAEADQGITIMIAHVPPRIVHGLHPSNAGYEKVPIPEAAWNRIAEYSVELRRINGGEARQVLEARLEPFLEPFRGLEPVHRHLQEDNLFPLGRN